MDILYVSEVYPECSSVTRSGGNLLAQDICALSPLSGENAASGGIGWLSAPPIGNEMQNIGHVMELQLEK